jgi:hypothetical protein
MTQPTEPSALDKWSNFLQKIGLIVKVTLGDNPTVTVKIGAKDKELETAHPRTDDSDVEHP